MGRTETNRTRMLEGPVRKTLVVLAIPMVFGVLSMVVYNLADTFFVGRLGKNQLAALSFTFPVVLVVNSMALGIGMGASAVVSRAIGAGDYARVRRLSSDSLILGLLIVTVVAITGRLTINPLFSLLGARGVILDHIAEYMRVWYFGILFVVVPMVGNNIIRATGDSKTPGIVMVIGATMNLVLDPLLIFGIGPFPALGIKGAALATLIGRSTTFTVAMYVLIFREKLISYRFTSPGKLWKSWKEILYIGIPNAGSKMIVPLGQGVITRVIAGYGAAAVAGYGVATRVEFFSLAAINALSSIIGPFIGQNLGAGKMDRVNTAITVSRHFSMYLGLGSFSIFLVLANRIAGLFNSDPEVISTAARYMRIVSAAYAAQGFYVVVSAGLNVLKRPLQAAGLGVLEMFVLSVPLVFLGSYLFGITGIFSAVGLSYLITGIASWLVVNRILLRYHSD